ncbi:hypothetical protein GCM10027418_03330 [Mariniluteicoccus endophyticus]
MSATAGETRTWYPRRTLMWSAGFSLLLIALSVWGWFGLERSIRDQFTGLQIATLIFFELVMIFIMMSVATCTVTADAAGLRIRNVWAVRRLAWDDVAEIRFRQGDPWAFAVGRVGLGGNPLDAPKTMMLGIQSVDGKRAVQAVQELRRLHAEHTAD